MLSYYVLDACVYSYGSLVSNFALVDSDLNINIQTEEPAWLLTELLEVLRHFKTGVNLFARTALECDMIKDLYTVRIEIICATEIFVLAVFTVWSVAHRILLTFYFTSYLANHFLVLIFVLFALKIDKILSRACYCV